MKNLIGILAGMGPRSTSPFIDLVIDECQRQYGAKYDEDFPPMMIYSLPTPFYVDRPIDHELMKKTIIGGLKSLEKTGVSFIAMPCNSAHIYFEELKSAINIPLLNIIEETVNSIPKTLKKVTLFSTEATFGAEIYQKGIIESGHDFIFKPQWQAKINALIQGIKNNKNDIENVKIWNRLMEEVKAEGIQSLVIACTDLSTVIEKTNYNIYIVDSSKCLALTVVKKYLTP